MRRCTDGAVSGMGRVGGIRPNRAVGVVGKMSGSYCIINNINILGSTKVNEHNQKSLHMVT